MNDTKILVTLGPNSLKENTIRQMDKEDVSLFRINLSHTKINDVESVISKIQKNSETPICLDSEGAQIRNQSMSNNKIYFNKDDIVKIHFKDVLGDGNNISFTPKGIARKLYSGDKIYIDFDCVILNVIKREKNYCLAIVENDGIVGSNKAVNVDRMIDLNTITEKDKKAIEIGRNMGVKNYALSFTQSRDDIVKMRKLIGEDTNLICKVESMKALINLEEIIDSTDQILIDRGDLSRQVSLEKIPFLQRRIISAARSKRKPVFVATNLLESMVTQRTPSRAELNDVVSTLLMGADGLVLAAETAVGAFPVDAVKLLRNLINESTRWTENTSITEILAD